MKKCFVSLLIIVLFRLGITQLIADGSCGNVTSVKDFDIKKLIGNWYIYKYIDNIFSSSLICSKDELILDGDKILRGKFRSYNQTSNGIIDIPYNTKIKNEPSDATFTTEFTFKGSSFLVNSKIIDLDYNNYYAVWQCQVLDGKSYTFFWIISRQTTLSDKYENKVKVAMERNNLQWSNLKMMQHNNNCDNIKNL